MLPRLSSLGSRQWSQQQQYSTTKKATGPLRSVGPPQAGSRVAGIGHREANARPWMLAALSTTTATPATSSTGGAARGKRRKTAGATTNGSVSASTTIGSPATTDATDGLHPDPHPHTRARAIGSASTAYGPSRPNFAEPNGRPVSAQKALKPTTEIGTPRHGSGSTRQRLKRQGVTKTPWRITSPSSYPRPYRIGSRDFQRIQSIPGEISIPNSSTTTRGHLRNLGLSGISTRSHKRKTKPSGTTSGGS